MLELRWYKNDSIWFNEKISFENAALFHSPVRAVEKDGNFKINLFFNQMASFLFCLCSKIYKQLLERSIITVWLPDK